MGTKVDEETVSMVKDIVELVKWDDPFRGRCYVPKVEEGQCGVI